MHGLYCDRYVLPRLVFMAFTILLVVQQFALLYSISLYKCSGIDYSILTFINIFPLSLPLWKFLKISFNVYLFLREGRSKTERDWGRGRERGRHRIRSSFQALTCQHRARHGAWTHKSRNHDLSQSQMLNRLSHPGTLRLHHFIIKFFEILNWKLHFKILI